MSLHSMTHSKLDLFYYKKSLKYALQIQPSLKMPKDAKDIKHVKCIECRAAC